MPSEEIYDLTITQATGLPLTLFHHPLDAYVEVTVDGFEYKTKVVKNTRNPSWNEHCQFITKSESSLLCIAVRHRSSIPRHMGVLASVNAKVGELVKMCGDGKEVELDLVPQDTGQIRIALTRSRSNIAANTALADAQKATENVGSGRPQKATNVIDSAQALISSQSGTFDALGEVLLKIDKFVDIVDQTANVHPYAKLTWQIVSSVYKVVRNQMTTDQKLIELVATMANAMAFVDAIQSDVKGKVEVLENVIKQIFTQTVECTIFIREYASHGFGARTALGVVQDNANTIERLSRSLLDLKRDFDSGVAVQTTIVTFRTQLDVTKILTNQMLDKLEPAKLEASGRPECLPSTRQDALNHIVNWATDPTQKQNVFWLHGMAGLGKSTLSTTVASYFRDLGRLGAFIFFDRAFPEMSHPSKVIRTLAYKLGSFDRRIGSAICSAIDNFPSVNDSSLHIQFSKLIIEPLATVADLPSEGPIILVLDALDECGNSTERAQLLNVLGTETSRLPPVFRVVFVSRKLVDIAAVFDDKPHILKHNLESSLETAGQDVAKFFEHQFMIIRGKTKRLRDDWPGSMVVKELVGRSCGLFVWASTTLKFIDTLFPEKRLSIILHSETATNAELGLDALYKTALQEATAWDDDDFICYFRTVMNVVLVLQNPLSISSLDQLIGLSSDLGSSVIISALACVLSQEPRVQFLHPSFADFLFSLERCGCPVWHFDAASCHRDVAVKCLERLLHNGLKHNICNSTMSSTERSGTISEAVAYACVHWINHVCVINQDALVLVELLRTFLTKHFLHWFEVMSILGRTWDTIPLLNKLAIWISSEAGLPVEKDLLYLIRDGCRFAQAFGSLIEEHPLLVYHGALPFTPINSKIYQLYHDSKRHPTVCGGNDLSWSPMLLALSKHFDAVSSVAFSTDGTRIVSGSHDYTVRVWDAVSGSEVIPPLRGHEEEVISVAFSLDGARIVSGSWDKTVRVWDAVSGGEVIPPLRGHEAWVTSVSFSPDSTRVVSGSYDTTVRIWDAVFGDEAILSLQGHEDKVNTVAFSLDGTRIVSGSYDTTIRVWDAISGGEVIPSLRGHEREISSVAFSPDGTRIVSGSYDKTIRIWDAISGGNIVSLLRGHESLVTSVAFSLDGARIVSGSFDKTVRLWDAVSGGEIVPPLRGHESIVTSVAFSPDGTHVVSGSCDKTVRVWDSALGGELTAPRHGHEESVTALAFSSDGTRIVSGSFDSTVQVWDAVSGAEVIPPLRGHRNGVIAVAFSPDMTRVATGSWDKTVRVWDAVSGGEIIPSLRGHEDAVNSVAFSPDGTRIVSGSRDKTVRIWDAFLGTELIPPLRGHKDDVTAVGFSPDGNNVVSGSWDKTVRVWDAISGEEVTPPLQGHEDQVTSVIFSQDGTQVVSQSYDDVRTWDLMTVHPCQSSTVAEPKFPGSTHFSISLKDDGWVFDSSSERILSKVPPMIQAHCSASHNLALVFGTTGGRVLIFNFPPSMLSISDTRSSE